MIYLGLSQSLLNRLQLVQNAAARLLTNTRKSDRITPILTSLQWLPIRFRIDFKTLIFIFKILNDLAPSYLSDLIILHQPVKNLRSADKLLLRVPRSRLKRKGDRAFSIAGPRSWNSLPLAIRSIPTLHSFKTALKKHFYSLTFNSDLGET